MVATTLGAACYLPVHVLITAAIAGDQGMDHLAPLVAPERILHADLAEAARHAIAMGAEPKRTAIVNGHHFIDAIAIEEAAIEGRNARFFERQALAVQIADGQRL